VGGASETTEMIFTSAISRPMSGVRRVLNSYCLSEGITGLSSLNLLGIGFRLLGVNRSVVASGSVATGDLVVGSNPTDPNQFPIGGENNCQGGFWYICTSFIESLACRREQRMSFILS